MEHNSYEDNIFFDYLGMRVWEKRHQYATEVLLENECRRVLDIGCNEGKLIQRLSRSSEFTYIAGLDIDLQILENAKDKILPEPIQDNIKKFRTQPLVVELIKGDATKKSEFIKSLNFDAITLIEMIEHITIEQLQDLVENLFTFLRPKVIVITTPNADFNFYFKQLDDQFKFRHPDHKYEMTRAQFTSWAEQISHQYCYQLRIDGVGPHKSGNMELGFCSQIAIFKRNDTIEFYEPTSHMQDQESASFFFRVDYPFDFRNKLERLKDLLKYPELNFKSRENTEDEEDWMYEMDQYKIIRLIDMMNNIDIQEIFLNFEELCETIKMLNEDVVRIKYRGNTLYALIPIFQNSDSEIENFEDEY